MDKPKTKRGAKAPRTITPHKGGRTERIHARITPETLEAVKATGMSAGDFIEWAVGQWAAQQNMHSTGGKTPASE